MRIDSVAHTVTLTSFAFFLSSGLNSATGTPAYGILSDAANPDNMKPWSQPCGTPVAAALKRMPQRHSVHRALKRVRTQLRVAQLHFKKDIKDVNEIYSKVFNVLNRKNYNINWLPENQYEWYYREIWCLEKGKKAERALPRLYEELRKFAITFHYLREFQLKSNIRLDLTMRRNKIIDGMYNEILRVLCEVETAISNLGLHLPKQRDVPKLAKNRNWAKEGDFTSMLIQDWGVLRFYRNFLNNWLKAFRNATATGPGTCDPNIIRPLHLRPKNATKGIGGKSKKIPKIRKPTRLMRKHPLGPGRNSSLPQRPRKGPPRSRLMRKKQNNAT